MYLFYPTPAFIRWVNGKKCPKQRKSFRNYSRYRIIKINFGLGPNSSSGTKNEEELKAVEVKGMRCRKYIKGFVDKLLSQ